MPYDEELDDERDDEDEDEDRNKPLVSDDELLIITSIISGCM